MFQFGCVGSSKSINESVWCQGVNLFAFVVLFADVVLVARVGAALRCS